MTATLNTAPHQILPFTAYDHLGFLQFCSGSSLAYELTKPGKITRKTRRRSLASLVLFGSFSFAAWEKMQLHISPSLRHVTVLPGKGVREFIKVKVGSRRLSYRMLFYSLLFLTFLLRFVFVLSAVDTIDGESKCSTIGMSFH